MVRILSILIAVLGQSSVYAMTNEHPQQLKHYYTQEFKGWQGIEFICEHNSQDKAESQLCDRATQEFSSSAASNQIAYSIAQNFHDALSESNRMHYIVLRCALLSNAPASSNEAKAISATLSFESHYSNAIEHGSKSGPKSAPKSGQLVLWSTSMIGAGAVRDLVIPFGDGLENKLDKAISLFMKYSGQY